MTAFKKDIVDCFSCTGIDSSIEQQVEHYHGNLSNIFDKHAPVTIKSVVLRPNTEWYSDHLNNAKRDKRKAERKWRDSKFEVHHQMYTEKCRTVDKLLYIAKETYYSSKIENCGNDHKQLFKLTKHLMGKQQQTPLPSLSSDLELSNSFADFFVNKVVTIRDGLRDQNVVNGDNIAFLQADVEFTGDRVRVISSFNLYVCDIAVTPTNDILLVTNQPQLKQIKAGFKKITDSIYCPDISDLWRVHVTKDGLVIVGVNKVVIVMDTDGKHLTMYEKDENNQQLFSGISSITSITNGNIFVACIHDRKVVVFQKIEIISIYRGHPSNNHTYGQCYRS
ncbi:Hypothetical predicted protein [Mytilus galloprovincialis]|uniref:Uncharacterized protein n=1 Tax=Mytilus galloprovincialis TaxID=29158 RepID=A0A8B6FCQ9_MYTGA|nr:Hypothetical predicted protein [Mytilus galloprovincialis]